MKRCAANFRVNFFRVFFKALIFIFHQLTRMRSRSAEAWIRKRKSTTTIHTTQYSVRIKRNEVRNETKSCRRKEERMRRGWRRSGNGKWRWGENSKENFKWKASCVAEASAHNENFMSRLHWKSASLNFGYMSKPLNWSKPELVNKTKLKTKKI